MKQLTVLVPNELGIAARLTTCLAERGINIEEIDVESAFSRAMSRIAGGEVIQFPKGK